MKSKVKLSAVILSFILIGSVEPVFPQANFYEGKTIRFIVGFSAGGGYDTYTRLIARHMGKYVPGNPVFVVDNMAGAGSMISANYVYKVAKPDGLTIGHFIGGLFLQQLLAKPGIEFDSLKFEYIGVPAQDHFILGVAKSTGITDPEKWIASKQIVKFGGVATGSGTDDFPTCSRRRLARRSNGFGLQGHRRCSFGIQQRRGYGTQQFLGIDQVDLEERIGKRRLDPRPADRQQTPPRID
jgi:tripartite-type tricarboxylate transporter receptor subunit TctC